MYFLHHVAQQQDRNIECDVKTGWIWQYIRVRRNSLIYLSSKPRPPRYRRSLLGRPPSRHSLEPVPLLAMIQGSDQPSCIHVFYISDLQHVHSLFTKWLTNFWSWAELPVRGRNDWTSPVESYEQAGVTCTRSGMPASHSRLLCLPEQGSSF